MNVLSLFDGISCGQVALQRAGIKVDNYYASEVDKYAMRVTMKNYPNTIQLGDVRNVKGSELPEIGLLMGGSPCQGFSFAGKQLNFEDERSKLFFEFVRLLEEVKPKYFLLENVKMKKEYQDIISQYLGVEPIEINSALVSAQNRKRLYWTNIKDVKQPEDKHIYLRDMISGCEFYTVRDQGKTLHKKINKAHTLMARDFKGFGNQGMTGVVQDGEVRRLTPNEHEILQNLDVEYTSGISNTQRYKATGNGWTVDVISHIFSHIKEIPKETVFEYNCIDVFGNPSGCQVCPTCREPAYDDNHCVFCGQVFKPTENKWRNKTGCSIE